jgi:hypothetical protein
MEEETKTENGHAEEVEKSDSSESGATDSKAIFNIRATLNEEQLQKLDDFKEKVFSVPPADSPFHHFNDKHKNKKRGPTEPPLARLWVEELSDKQKEWLDDSCLCRYLRARDWDLEKAEHMIRCTLAWRDDYKPEEITAAEIEDQSKTGKMYFNYEFTKQGWPIVYMKLNRDQGHDRVTKLKFMVWMLEKIISAMDTSRGVEKMAWVTDFKGTGMRMATMSHINISLDCLHTLLDHYPERLGVAYAMNPPRVFSAFWKILTPFMNEVTINKIKFISGHKEYAAVEESIDKAVLEKTYGGEKDYDYDHDEFVAREINGEGKAKKDN